MDPYDEKVAVVVQKIRQERERQKMSQMELANIAGLSQSFYSEVESGKSTPTLKTVLKIADALNLNLKHVFDGLEPDREKAKDEIIRILREKL